MSTLRRLFLIPLLAFVVFGAAGCYSTPQGGQIGVVRNGGPIDNHNIRQLVPEGAGNTWVGFASESHYYPASDQQRLYKFDDGKDADAPPITVPSKDGVHVRLTGTFYISTAFDNTTAGRALLRAFDTAYGTRTFGPSKHALKPWEDGGFPLFLNAVLKPVIDSNVREVIAEFECKQLVSSCALVQRTGQGVDPNVIKSDGKSNVTLIQDRINQNLTQEIQAKLGRPYFRNIRFSLGPVELPGVQDAIDSAQSAFADVSKAQAKVIQAKADAQANRERQKGYNGCPACQRIDTIAAWKGTGVTTVVNGGAGVAVK